MKILILSDLHLNTPKGVLKRFGTEDPIAAIDSIRRIAEAENPDACIIAGDIFNGTKQDDTEIHLFRKLKNALSSIHAIYVIRGNHDRAEHSIPTDMFDWIELSENPVYLDPEKKITISGLHFSSTEKHREYLSCRRSDIMVCHFPMSPFNNFNPENISIEAAPADCVVVVGDTHKPEVVLKEDKCVISPGCLFPANKAELLSGVAGSSYMLNISKESGELEVDLKAIRLDSRFGADLTGLSVLDEVVDELKLIDARRPFPANLKPVAFISLELSTKSELLQFSEKVELIPVAPQAETSSGAAVDFSGLEGIGVTERIDKILSAIFEGDTDADAAKGLASALILSDSPTNTIEQFIKAR
jgi:DNA repair exonuclease SbcCD nuclease subunit